MNYWSSEYRKASMMSSGARLDNSVEGMAGFRDNGFKGLGR
jgi:hypothetical protein